ncbi:MAG: phage holin family protein [Cyclobacteriaceae bacterium]
MKSSVYIAGETVDMFKDSLSKFFKVDSLLSNLTGYVETRVELLKIEVKEDLAKSLAQAITYLFISFILALFLTFVSIAVALLISARLGNFAGFSIVGLAYLTTGLILWLSREKLISKLEKRFVLMFRKKK